MSTKVKHIRPDEILVRQQWETHAVDKTFRIVWQLQCPICGEPVIEQQSNLGGEAACVTVQPDRDEYDSPIGTRGGYAKIQTFCGNGHGIDIIIANHKGCQFIGLHYGFKRDYGSPDAEPAI